MLQTKSKEIWIRISYFSLGVLCGAALIDRNFILAGCFVGCGLLTYFVSEK